MQCNLQRDSVFLVFSFFQTPPEIMEDLGTEGVKLFRQHDRDNDGHLTIEEFEPLAHRLLDSKVRGKINKCVILQP